MPDTPGGCPVAGVRWRVSGLRLPGGRGYTGKQAHLDNIYEPPPINQPTSNRALPMPDDPMPGTRQGRPYISLTQHTYMKCRDTPGGCPVGGCPVGGCPVGGATAIGRPLSGRTKYHAAWPSPGDRQGIDSN